MICKTLIRKRPSYRQLFYYITQPINHLTAQERSEVVFKYNVYGDLEDWVAQFKENEEHRKYHRRDNTKLVHEIISFHQQDTNHITTSFLKNFLRHYAQVRADGSMFVAVLHRHQANVHLHVAMHPLNFRTGYSITKKRRAYREMLQSLQQFHTKHYPQITKSTVDFTTPKERKYSDKEHQYKQRTGKPSAKDLLIETISYVYQEAGSRTDFLETLKAQQMRPYNRRSKLTGIITPTGRKYRFRTLGISDIMLQELDRQHETAVDRQPTHSPYFEKIIQLRTMRKRSTQTKEKER